MKATTTVPASDASRMETRLDNLSARAAGGDGKASDPCPRFCPMNPGGGGLDGGSAGGIGGMDGTGGGAGGGSGGGGEGAS